jgi:peptidoglycan hydrolase-like protein with peptidoglycan-binding domain
MSLIVVQRGHVPRTSGATGAPGEQQFAIEAAARCVHHINACGHEVRVIDADVPTSYYKGDAFFALHYDSSRDPGVGGASVGYQSSEGAYVARRWKDHYVQNGWTGGFRPDNYTSNLAGYYGVRNAVAAGTRHAIITEAGFHSESADSDPDPDDSVLLASPGGPDRIGISIASTVVDLFGVGGGVVCPPSPGIPAFPGTVKLGSTGHAVSTWQRAFNDHFLGWGPNALVVDGDFGLATHHVVVFFQKQRGLVVDGIAGQQTWHSLILG